MPETGVIPGETSPQGLHDKHSIAVLPFVNMSGDPQQEYFSDGITENIITGLSKSPMLLVIARNSSFAYKGRAVKIQQVGRELGVQYVLEGSIQRSDKRVRVNAQLIDAANGQHLWAERYDRDLKDLFALQDEITMKIVSALHVKLTGHERARMLAEGTENLDAYLKLLRGFALLRSRSPDDALKAGKIAEEVIAMDPDYPKGYILLAMTLTRDAWHKKGTSTAESLDRAFELAKKALAMDQSLVGGYLVLGDIYLLRKEHEKAIAELEKAAALNPNAFEVIAELGKVLLWSGRSQEAIRLFERAIRLNPVDAHYYELRLAKGYRMMEEYEKAIPVFEKIAKKDPDRIGVRLELIACYAALGKQKQADEYVAEVLKKSPGFSVGKFVNDLPYKDAEMKSRFMALLRKGGLPD